LVEQAVEAGKNGSKTSKNQEYLTRVLRPVISSSGEIKKLFLKDGKFLKYGDKFYNKDFSSFLSHFLYEDPETFYINEVCPLFYSALSRGGIISLSDLQNYQTKERKPLSKQYKQHTVFTNPAPSTGGQTILDGLDALVNKKIVGPREIEGALIAANKKAGRGASKIGSTTHLSIIDKENNIASVTTTNGVGCGRMVPGTGIMPNNMLGEEHLNPGGFHEWKKRSRIPSNIAPTVLFKKNAPIVALGSAGSSRIISAILCTLSNLVNNKMDLASAIESPRIHLEGDTLHHEPLDVGGVFPSFKTKKVVSWKEKNMYFGGVNAVGEGLSFGDDRRSGYSC
jgi:gamma-glutamyltranspeptidase/glutathione hydrolase